MSVAAAIRIDSPDDARVIEHAARFAQQQERSCFVISVVGQLPYGATAEWQEAIVERNLALIAACHATPIMQAGDDIAQTLITVGRAFGVATMFVQSGRPRFLGRSIAEQLIYLSPPFDVVIVGSQ